MSDETAEQATVSAEDAVSELIRLREADIRAREEIDAALRRDIAALWLRLEHLQRRRTWWPQIFG